MTSIRLCLLALPLALACGAGFEVRREGRNLILLDAGAEFAKVVVRSDGSPWLTDVRLSPGAPTAIGRMSLFWWQYVNNEAPGRSVSRLLDLDARAHSDRLEILVGTDNGDGAARSHYTATITREPSGKAYRIDFATTLTIPAGRQWTVTPQSGVEFTDIYWPVERVVQGREWPQALYRDGAGVVRTIPLNHADSANKFNIYFHARDAFIGLAGPTAVNPVFELDPETARETFAELCAYSYDLHLLRRVNPTRRLHSLVSPEDHYGQRDSHTLPAGTRLQARFRLRLQTPAEVTRRIQAARLLEIPPAWWDLWRVPVFQPLNRFDTLLDPAKPDPRWYWETPTPAQATWDPAGQLRVDGPAYWETKLGREFFGEPFRSAQSYRISARVRSPGPSARAWLAFQFGPGAPEWRSPPAAGGEWQTLTLDIPAQPEGSPWLSRASLRLVVEGRGTAWFDDVELRPR